MCRRWPSTKPSTPTFHPLFLLLHVWRSIRQLLQQPSEAGRAIGRLDGVAMLLPDKALFLYMYARKEAVLSSQIEGTQSTLDDLLQYENAALVGKPLDDITEVSNYVDAIMFGLGVLRDPKGLPLCLRLLRDMNARLLQKGRGQGKNPGEFRRSQNWIGGKRPGNAYARLRTLCIAADAH